MIEVLVRFLIGGVVVSAFAICGDVLRPKSFAGLFGAASSVAVASLALTSTQHTRSFVAPEGRSMVYGVFDFLMASQLQVGVGAVFSTTFGGKLIQHFSYRISLLSLVAVVARAFILLWVAIPETLWERNEPDSDSASHATNQELSA